MDTVTRAGQARTKAQEGNRAVEQGEAVTGPAGEALLVVGDFESRCSACGGGATTSETAHVTQLPGYTGARVGRGCGRDFTGVARAEDALTGGRVHVVEIANALGLSYVGVRPMPRQPVGGGPTVAPVEPAAHARGMVHPEPIPGCSWCPPTVCPCGGRCDDPAGCYRRWAASETTWREWARPARGGGGG